MTVRVTCENPRPHRSHRGCEGVLHPDDERLVAQFAALYDLAALGPWWHQAAGRDPADKAGKPTLGEGR